MIIVKGWGHLMVLLKTLGSLVRPLQYLVGKLDIGGEAVGVMRQFTVFPLFLFKSDNFLEFTSHFPCLFIRDWLTDEFLLLLLLLFHILLYHRGVACYLLCRGVNHYHVGKVICLF